jgi:hypothetical protein
MMRSMIWTMGLSVVVSLAAAAPCVADTPFQLLVPFQKIDADPNKSYELKDRHGPWLILGATFFGDPGEAQAKQLVLELRRDHKLVAYTYRKIFDYGDTVVGRGLDKYGRPKQMRHVHASRFKETAVLIGEFESTSDPKIKKTLEQVKYMHPQTLSATKENPTAQRFVIWRAIQKSISTDKRQKTKGPMGSAFVSRNPLLPEEFFRNKGPDKFVMDLNSGIKYSLLDCPGEYTVKVATFRGEATWDANKMKELEESGKFGSRLAEGADKAHRLVVALRKHGVEAYEFHDRHESIVTVGSFRSYGQRRADGKIEIDPGIHKLMKSYAAQPHAQTLNLPGAVMAPRVLAGITFDVQPLPIHVPGKGSG